MSLGPKGIGRSSMSLGLGLGLSRWGSDGSGIVGTPILGYPALEVFLAANGADYGDFELYLDSIGEGYPYFEGGNVTEESLLQWIEEVLLGASLTLSWTDTSGIETGYRIEKSDDNITYETVATVGANVETYTITGLPFNHPGWYRVIVFNEVGDQGVPLGPVQLYTAPPEAPTSVAALALDDETIRVSWTLPGTEPVTGYKIYAAETGSPLVAVGEVAAGTSQFDFTTVGFPSTSYDFEVVGYNDNSTYTDGETARSNTANAITGPVLLSANISTDGNSLTLNFSGPITAGSGGAAGFALTMSGGAVTPTYSSGDGTPSRTYSLSRTIKNYETGTFDYTQPGNGFEDQFGTDLGSVVGFAVVNGSTAYDDVVVSYADTDTNDATWVENVDITFPNIGLGAENARRKIFIAVCLRADGTDVNLTVTLGGVACTFIAKHLRNVSGQAFTEFWYYIDSTTGTAANLVITPSVDTGTDGAWLTAYTFNVIGASATTVAVVGSDGGAQTIDIVAGGAILGAFSGNANTTNLTYTGVTANASTLQNGSDSSAVASHVSSTAETARPVQIDNGADNGESTLFISLQPTT